MTESNDISKRSIINVIIERVIIFLAVAMVIYHFLYPLALFQSSFKHRVSHLGFALLLIFLKRITAVKLRSAKTLYLILLLGVIFSQGYTWLFSDVIEEQFGFPTMWEVVVGIIVYLTVVEGTRIGWGNVVPVLAIFTTAYLFLGHLLPSDSYLHHPYIPWKGLISLLAIDPGSQMSSLLLASADFIFLFVFLGVMMAKLGVDRFFVELGKAVSMKIGGGAGITSLVSNSLLGMVSGVAMTNAVITGPFTVPLMKKQGYSADEAGAVVAVGSTGGQVMPPVMGIAAFVMVVLSGYSYQAIMAAAWIPALLFYLAAFLGLRSMVVKHAISAATERIDTKLMLTTMHTFIVPVITLCVLLAMRYSPMYSALFSIMALLIVSYTVKSTRPTIKNIIYASTEAALMASQVAIVLAGIGFVVQCMTTTGIGLKLTAIIDLLSFGSDYMVFTLTAIVCLILGAGMPTPAAYCLTAAIGVPLMESYGVATLAAHMFVFYYAILSAITPPVATAALVSAKVSGGRFWGTSIESMRLSFPLYVVPFLWVKNEVFIGNFSAGFLNGVTDLFFGLLGIILLAPALQGSFINGRLMLWNRIIYGLSGVFLFIYVVIGNSTFLSFGFGLGIFAILSQLFLIRRDNLLNPVPLS